MKKKKCKKCKTHICTENEFETMKWTANTRQIKDLYIDSPYQKNFCFKHMIEEIKKDIQKSMIE